MINNTTLPSFSQFRLGGVPFAPRTLIYLCLLAVVVELFILGLAALGQLSLVDATESAAFMLGVWMLAALALRRLGTGMVTLNDEGLVVKRPITSEKYKWEHIQDLRMAKCSRSSTSSRDIGSKPVSANRLCRWRDRSPWHSHLALQIGIVAPGGSSRVRRGCPPLLGRVPLSRSHVVAAPLLGAGEEGGRHAIARKR